jgi:hypothetical protein
MPVILCLLFGLFLVVCAAEPAGAFRNMNGAILVHTQNDVSYSTAAEFCGHGSLPLACDGLNPHATRSDNQVVWIFAAFAPGSNPAVTAIAFGITHTFSGRFLLRSPCGPGSVCRIETRDDCFELGGDPRGSGSTCPPDPPCPEDVPKGACCISLNDECIFTTEADCRVNGLQYWGDGIPCENAPECFNTPTKRMTWGAIKAGFR